MRRVKWVIDDVTYDIEAIPCSVETCAITHSKIMFREDDVISILYTDGRIYTVHKDGTRMFTSSDETEIVIEKEGYATVRIRLGVRSIDNVQNLSQD